MKKTLLVIFGVISLFCFSQNKYYRLFGKEILTESNYQKFKDSIKTNGSVSEEIVLTYNKNDSTFVLPKLKIKNNRGLFNLFNETAYFEQTFKKKIDFTNLQIIKNNKNIDKTKPYFVNMWYVNCAPCVAEIPDLNKLSLEYKDSVNFIGLTFDNAVFVEKFLQKTPFNFVQIPNQKELLTKMQINSYPTSFILDKDGNFVSFVNYQNEKAQNISKKILNRLIQKQ